MAKFIKFLEYTWGHEEHDYVLRDISINVNYISIVRKTDVVHTFKKFDIETNKYIELEEPCTEVGLYDEYSNVIVLGSYKEVLSKIHGE